MDSLRVSERGSATPWSPIRKLTPFSEKAEEDNVKVFHLNIGQPDILTPSEFYSAVKEYSQKVLAYGPSNGLPRIRKSFLDYYHNCGYSHIREPDLMVTTAGSEAVVFSMMAVASPGDEIIVFEPFYPNYNGFAAMAGVKLVPVSTDPETGYHLPDAEIIEEKITQKTKAILICTPNNPTGTVLRKEEMETIESIALKHNLFVLSDEVYREFVFDGEYTSILSFPELEKNAVLMDSISKRYSACGARIGCIISKNREIMDTVMKFGQARLCPPTLEQVGASAVIATGDKYFADMIEEYKIRRDFVYEALTKIPGVECKKPQGAFYMMVRFPVDDIEDFAKWLLTDFRANSSTTMIAPGPGFYATPGKGGQEARIAYVLNTDDLDRAVEILEKGLEVYNRRKIGE
ncbi:pyridoxal phosphate-dependent aminotransferase [bacterium]|nr:pyridoxal phosphate-dependent aminotransferase [bacterium]